MEKADLLNQYNNIATVRDKESNNLYTIHHQQLTIQSEFI